MRVPTRHVAVVVRALALAAGVVCFAGASCSKSKTEPAADKGSEPVKAEKTAVAADPAAAKAAAPPAEKIKLAVNDFGGFGYKPLYAEYQQSHPNIEIVESVNEYNSHHTNLINHLAAGSGAADIEAVDEGFMAQLKSRPEQFANLL